MMLLTVPLRSTVRIQFEFGSMPGQRLYRVSHALDFPPRLRFSASLPLEGEAQAVVSFMLPDGQRIAAGALVRYDPQHPEHGSEADLIDVSTDQLGLLRHYAEQRMTL